jgi:hypothetical protein
MLLDKEVIQACNSCLVKFFSLSKISERGSIVLNHPFSKCSMHQIISFIYPL